MVLTHIDLIEKLLRYCYVWDSVLTVDIIHLSDLNEDEVEWRERWV